MGPDSGDAPAAEAPRWQDSPLYCVHNSFMLGPFMTFTSLDFGRSAAAAEALNYPPATLT